MVGGLEQDGRLQTGRYAYRVASYPSHLLDACTYRTDRTVPRGGSGRRLPTRPLTCRDDRTSSRTSLRYDQEARGHGEDRNTCLEAAHRERAHLPSGLPVSTQNGSPITSASGVSYYDLETSGPA